MEQIDIPRIKMETEPSGRWRLLLSRRLLAVTAPVLALAILAIFFGIILPVQATMTSGRQTYALIREVSEELKNQNVVGAEEKLSRTKESLARTKKSFSGLRWTKYLPVFGAYTSDGEHLLAASSSSLETLEIVFQAILPYADLLGLKGKGTFTGGTTEERIVKAVETLDKVIPEVDKVAAKLLEIQDELDAIDPQRYPKTFQGKPVRQRLVEVQNLVDTASAFLNEARPMVKKLPDLLGNRGEKRYLVLFQNDGELRPTGGFITAYAIFKVEKGKIGLETSDDIYKLDETITKRPAPPWPIKTYLGEHVWYLRNSNFSPDFPLAMKNFQDIYSNSRAPNRVDGIIAVDTQVLVKLMEVVGPVAAYGVTFTTDNVSQCDCPMVIWELEKYADEPKSYERGSRKDIIGVLLSELLKKTLSSPPTLLASLGPAVISQMQQKHILLYFTDPDAQAGVEALEAAGSIRTVAEDTDYLHVNNANLGGAKSNLYVEEKVSLNVETEKDKTVNNLVIEYKHTRRADNCSLERKQGLCLSGVYRDYLRVYLPKGSTLLESRGFESKSSVFEDIGHSVVDGYFTVVPLGLGRVQIKYQTPVKTEGVYKIFLQKQPGTRGNHYKITVDGKTRELPLLQDTKLEFK